MTVFYYSDFTRSEAQGGIQNSQEQYFQNYINQVFSDGSVTQSQVFPVGTVNPNSGFGNKLLSDDINDISNTGLIFVGIGTDTLAQTTLQSGRLFRAITPQLAAQTITAQTWTATAYVQESNAQANMFLAMSIYVYNFNTGTVRGFIYDNSTALAAEFPTNLGIRTASVSGSAVTCQDGDCVVIEMWYVATQGKALTYQYFGFPTDTTAASQVTCTQNLLFFKRKRRIAST